MRVLVTGHEGYLGSVLTRHLALHGHDVRGLDIGLYRNCRTEAVTPIPALRHDIRDVERRHFEGNDAVIHLAGLSNDPLGQLDPAATEQINLVATERVGECARAAGVSRLLFASSCSVYGAAGDEFLNEDSPLNPQTTYATCKMLAEQRLSQLAQPGFAVSHLRLATVFGASPFIRFDLVVNNLTAWAVTTGNVHLKSDGKSWRPVLHVGDVSEAFRLVMETHGSDSPVEVMNVGHTDANYRIESLAREVEKEVSGAHISYSDQPEADRRSYRVNCDRFRSVAPSFRPRRSLAQGIGEVRDLVTRLALTCDDFEGPVYRRSDHLLRLRKSGQVDDAFRWVDRREESDYAFAAR